MEMIKISAEDDKLLLFGFGTSGHLGRCNVGTPPQSLSLPTSDAKLVLEKIPFVGTSPLKLLKDKFRLDKSGQVDKYFGIFPKILLEERFRDLMLLKELKDKGIEPMKEF